MFVGGSYLTHVDTRLSRHPHFVYERYMDDFLLLSPTRWPLKRVIAKMNGLLADEGVE